jgi:predicted nucleotidyltransferase
MVCLRACTALRCAVVSSLQRELHDLTAAGILKSHGSKDTQEPRQGRLVYYQANARSPRFPDLRGLLLKTVGLVDILADALRPLIPNVGVAFVYGFVASGQERSDSDIDLMVIGNLFPVELAIPLRHARELLGREINPTVYSPAEFAKKRAAKDHFLTQVLSKPRLLVLGDENELDKTARK